MTPPRRLAAALALATLALGLLWLRRRPSDPETAAGAPQPRRGTYEAQERPNLGETERRPSEPPRAPARTLHDRAQRDALRAALVTLWQREAAAARAEQARDAATDDDAGARYPAMPTRDGGVDPEYLRSRIREDFLPMAGACYDQLLARRPGVEGRVVIDFTLVGDSRVGGVVDEASLHYGDAGVADAGLMESGFETCLRESMLAMAFAPPPGSGQLRVRYPLNLRPDAPDAGR